MAILSRLNELSLKGRVARRLMIPACLLMLLASVAIALSVQGKMRRVFDDALLFQAQAIAGNVELDEGRLELEFAPGLMLYYGRDEEPDYFQLWTLQGESFSSSPSLKDSQLAFARPANDEPVFRTAAMPDGRSGRFVSVGFLPRIETDDDEDLPVGSRAKQSSPAWQQPDSEAPDSDPVQATPVVTPVVLTVATSNQAYLDLVRQVWLILGVVFVALMAAFAWLLRRSLRSGLEPLSDIRTQIMALDGVNLERRINPKQSVTELNDIVDQTNGLLSRLESSFQRERQFSHDVAHELRTPLAELRNLAEVGSRWPGDEAMASRFFSDAIAASAQMDQTLSNLLSLARTERNLEVIEQSRFDLSELLQETWLRLCSLTQTDPGRLTLQLPESFQLFSGRHQWALIFQNLFSNAIAHGDDSGQVVVRLIAGPGSRHHDLHIENESSDLLASDLPHLFDRLWRKEQSRTQQHHSGLGLSLVKAYSEQLDLGVAASIPSPTLFRITLSGVQAVPVDANRADQPAAPRVQRGFGTSPDAA